MKMNLLLLWLPILVAGAESGKAVDAAGIFQEKYDELKAAVESRQSANVLQMLAPGFVSIDLRGKSQSAGEMAKEIELIPVDTTRKSGTTILSTKVSGGSATVVQRYHMTKTATGSDGNPQPIELTTESEDEWVLRGGIWLVLKTDTRKMEYKVAGKTVVSKEKK